MPKIFPGQSLRHLWEKPYTIFPRCSLIPQGLRLSSARIAFPLSSSVQVDSGEHHLPETLPRIATIAPEQFYSYSNDFTGEMQAGNSEIDNDQWLIYHPETHEQFNFSTKVPGTPTIEGIAMWNVNVYNDFGADQRDNIEDFSYFQNYDSDFSLDDLTIEEDPIPKLGTPRPGMPRPFQQQRPDVISLESVQLPAVVPWDSSGHVELSDKDLSGPVGDAPVHSHPLYFVLPSDDGYYHCPFVATENCGYEPKQLKSKYDKHIDSHLRPFSCKRSECSDLRFSSTACLLRHEREAHDMHWHAEILCEYPPCNRSQPGQGFRRSYNCKDHMTRCHGWIEGVPMTDKKRRSTSTYTSDRENGKSKYLGMSNKKNERPHKKQQIAKLKQEWSEHKALMESLTRNLAPDGPLMSMQITQIQVEAQLLASICANLSKLTSRQ